MQHPQLTPSPPLPSVYTKFNLSYIFGVPREGVGCMWQCGTAESVEKSNHTTPAPPPHLRYTTEWEQCKQPLLLLAQLRAPVVHMPHFTHAPYHTLYIPNKTIPHAHPHPLSQPPKRDMTHSSHNMAQLPFLYAVVEIHTQRYMHGWSKIATEALDLGSRTRSEAPRTLSARCWTRFASFGVKPFFKVTKRAHQVL